MEALKAPMEDRSRLQAAAEGGTAALLGVGGGALLKRAMRAVQAHAKGRTHADR